MADQSCSRSGLNEPFVEESEVAMYVLRYGFKPEGRLYLWVAGLAEPEQCIPVIVRLDGGRADAWIVRAGSIRTFFPPRDVFDLANWRRLCASGENTCRVRSLKSALALIDLRLRRLTARYPRAWTHDFLTLHASAHLGPYWFELASDARLGSPALGYCISHRRLMLPRDYWSSRRGRRLVGMKRAALVELFGSAPTEAAQQIANLIDRLPYSCCKHWTIRKLIRVFSEDPQLRRDFHKRAIPLTEDVVRCVSHDVIREQVIGSARMWVEIAERSATNRSFFIEAARFLKSSVDTGTLVFPFQSLDHFRAVECARALMTMGLNGVSFPTLAEHGLPPDAIAQLCGDFRNFHFLSCPEALFIHSELKMGHCAFGRYLQEARDGTLIFWEITSGTRPNRELLTLSVRDLGPGAHGLRFVLHDWQRKGQALRTGASDTTINEIRSFLFSLNTMVECRSTVAYDTCAQDECWAVGVDNDDQL